MGIPRNNNATRSIFARGSIRRMMKTVVTSTVPDTRMNDPDLDYAREDEVFGRPTFQFHYSFTKSSWAAVYKRVPFEWTEDGGATKKQKALKYCFQRDEWIHCIPQYDLYWTIHLTDESC